MGRLAMMAKQYDAIPEPEDVEESRGLVLESFEAPSTSSSSRVVAGKSTTISSFAMGCAMFLAAFGVAATAMGGGSTGVMMMGVSSAPSTSSSSELVKTESMPQEKTNWVTTHPKLQAMLMSASSGQTHVQELPQLGKRNSKKGGKKKKEEELDFDIPDGRKLPEPVETSKSGGMQLDGKVVTFDENGNINTAPIGRTTVDNYRMNWATDVLFSNRDYSTNYIPMKEGEWKKKFKQTPGQGLMKPKDSMMTLDDDGGLIGRGKMPPSQLGEVEKDEDDNEIVHDEKKKEEKSSSHKDNNKNHSSSSSKNQLHG